MLIIIINKQRTNEHSIDMSSQCSKAVSNGIKRLPLVKLLTRPGCVTCDQAKFVLKRIKAQGVDFEGKVVNILKERQYIEFNDFLPVILVDEDPVCKTTVNEAFIRAAIEKAARKL